MIKRPETQDTTDTGVLSSNYGEITKYLAIRTQGEIQGTKEATLYASYLQILPLIIRGGQSEQNLLIFNLYLTPALSYVSDSKDYSLENFVAAKI